MKARKYVKSQSGAALLLVLFVVLFLSITGSVLLNATTYSLKSNETNERIQREFYSAEGAIDLVLDDMKTYEGSIVPIQLQYEDGKQVLDEDGYPIIKDVQQKGPYFYLKELSTTTNISKSIGSKIINITIDDIQEISSDKIHATLIAKSEAEPGISRYVEIDAKSQIPTLKSGELNKPVNYYESFNYSGSKNHDELNIDTNNARISKSTYQAILDNFDFENSIIYDNLDKYWNTNDADPNKVNSSNKDNGKGDSKGKTLTIKEGETLYIRNVNLAGSGNTKVQIQIDGILVVENFTMTGNATVIVNGALIVTNSLNKGGGGNDTAMIINSGIIANKMSSTGKNNYSGEAKGIDCSLLGLSSSLCSGPSSPDDFVPKNNPWDSRINHIEYKTKRN